MRVLKEQCGYTYKNLEILSLGGDLLQMKENYKFRGSVSCCGCWSRVWSGWWLLWSYKRHFLLWKPFRQPVHGTLNIVWSVITVIPLEMRNVNRGRWCDQEYTKIQWHNSDPGPKTNSTPPVYTRRLLRRQSPTSSWSIETTEISWNYRF